MDISVDPSSLAVHFEDVTCRVGKRTILNQISFAITRGSITGVLGPNGAGKTTLLRSIYGLRQPSTGTITVLNEKLPVRGVKLRQKIGVVFQETTLYDELTPFENLEFAASLYAVPNAKRRIHEVLALLSLSERARDKVRNLSGGLQRRVAIARSLLHTPEILIIDEPTLGVDVDTRHAIWSHLRLLKSTGTTIVVATNYLDEALALCDTVAVLRGGKLLTIETPEALVARAGSCLDIECTTEAAHIIASALSATNGILHINATASGVSIFLDGNTVSDSVMRVVLEVAAIQGFRLRGADLAEVFRALEEVAV